MIVKYRITNWSNRIERREFVRETAKFYVRKCLNGGERREAKVTNYDAHYDSYEEARAGVCERAEADMAVAERNLELAKKELEAALALPEHDPGDEG